MAISLTRRCHLTAAPREYIEHLASGALWCMLGMVFRVAGPIALIVAAAATQDLDSWILGLIGLVIAWMPGWFGMTRLSELDPPADLKDLGGHRGRHVRFAVLGQVVSFLIFLFGLFLVFVAGNENLVASSLVIAPMIAYFIAWVLGYLALARHAVWLSRRLRRPGLQRYATVLVPLAPLLALAGAVVILTIPVAASLMFILFGRLRVGALHTLDRQGREGAASVA